MSVVKKIILINIIVYGICHFLAFSGMYLNNILALYPFSHDYFSPYQLITHLVAHSSPEHLFFNMLFLLLSGPIVERHLGDKFTMFYILAGLFSSGLYTIGSTGAIIGASGVVSALMMLSVLLTFDDKKFPIRFQNIFFSVSIISEFYYAFTVSDDIAHWAHVFGFIFGVLYFFYYKKNIKNRINI